MSNDESKKIWYKKEIIIGDFDVTNMMKFIIFIMFTIFPLLVIPNRWGYFYFPRYLLLVILGCISIYCVYKNFEKKFIWAYIPLIIYVLCLIIATVTSKDIFTSVNGLFGLKVIPLGGDENNLVLLSTAWFTGLITWIFSIVLFFVAYKVEDKRKLLKYMIITASIIGLISLFQYFNFNIVPHENFKDNYRPYGTIGHHNYLAAYCVFIVPASIHFFIVDKKKTWLLSSILIYTGMIVSGTRGSWIAFAITMVIMAYYYLKKKEYRKWFIVAILALGFVTAILMLTKDGALYSRLSTVSQNVSDGLQLKSSAGSNRMSIWKQVIPIIFEHWSFGVGLDNLIYYGVHLGNTVIGKSDNIYLDLAVSAGIPALLSYLVFLSYFIFRKWKNEKTFLFFIMIFTYLVQAFFTNDVLMVLPLFWIVLGMSFSNIQEGKQRS